MKTLTKIFVVITGTIFLLQPFAFAAKAPGGVDEIFEAMEELEESYENYRWEDALGATDKIRATLEEVFAQSQLADAALEKKVTDLRESVEKKQHDETDINYIRFQKQFFTFISAFDYDVHPVLNIIEEYIFEEAAEAAEKKEFHEVASEMVEVGNFIETATPFLLEKGVTEDAVSEFKSEVFNLIKAARKEDASQMDASMDKVKTLYKSFMAQYDKS